MKGRLPVSFENRKLPMDDRNNEGGNSYGYVNVLFLASIITTIASIITILILVR